VGAIVIFTPDVNRLAAFYEKVLPATPVYEETGDCRLRSSSDEVVVHSIPKSHAKDIVITTPPTPRTDTALKPVFDVVSLSASLAQVEAGGGIVTDHTFSYQGLTRHDVVDPDGNVVQLRSPA